MKVLASNDIVELVPGIVNAVFALAHLFVGAFVRNDASVYGYKLVIARDAGGIIGGFNGGEGCALFEGKDGLEVSSN